MKKKLIFSTIAVVVVAAIGFWLYFFYFNVERSNILKRSIDKYTGQDLTVTIFSYDGKIIKQWHNVKKITSGGKSTRFYTYFYTQDGKYVQIPNSVTYIAEEE